VCGPERDVRPEVTVNVPFGAESNARLVSQGCALG
jgi:hypothetical protein